jgi:hypothetical protein
MATAERMTAPLEQPVEKGLMPGALGLVSTTVIATASVAPAYSIAATLVFVVGAVGLQAPAVTMLAFVPMLLTSIGYSELNKADPDCGTTFTWATRAFGPRSGWAGGWAIIVADVLVMASLAQVAALVIADAVIAIGLFIAFYYGLTGFACAWYYRKNLTSSARNLWMQGILPVAGGLMLYFLGGWSVWLDYNVATENDYTMWTVPGLHWQVGGAFVIAAIAVLVGLACYIYCRITRPAFFRKQTLTRATPTLTPDPSLPKEVR